MPDPSPSNRLLIFVVAYNAEKHIAHTLDRIPRSWIATQHYEILIIDDASPDRTTEFCKNYKASHPELNLAIFTNDRNMGYGGNQKIGYKYAIEHGFDIVVLLHGDGQYDPEFLPQMTTPISTDQADVVLGSRMIYKLQALRGKMPFYKWIGNQVLSTIQNSVLGTSLSEFHTGYRAYKVDALQSIPLEANSDYFDFDTEILIQHIDQNMRIQEISIPTFYGDEISYVNGFKYAWLIMKATIISRFCKWGWLNDARFSYAE